MSFHDYRDSDYLLEGEKDELDRFIRDNNCKDLVKSENKLSNGKYEYRVSGGIKINLALEKGNYNIVLNQV